MIKVLQEKLDTQIEGEGTLFLELGICEEMENDKDEEEEESVEKKGKALALVPPKATKTKTVKIVEPMVKKYVQRGSSKPIMPTTNIPRTRVSTTGVELPQWKGVV